MLSSVVAASDARCRLSLGFLEGFLRPGTGDDVVGRAPGQQVQRDLGELQGRAALQEQHLVVGGNVQQLAQVGFGLGDDGGELLAAMAHFHHRHAAAVPVEQVLRAPAPERPAASMAGPALKFQSPSHTIPPRQPRRWNPQPDRPSCLVRGINSIVLPPRHRRSPIDHFSRPVSFSPLSRLISVTPCVARPMSRISRDPGADQHAAGGDQHDFVFVFTSVAATTLPLRSRSVDRHHALRAAPSGGCIRRSGCACRSRFRSRSARSAFRFRPPAGK